MNINHLVQIFTLPIASFNIVIVLWLCNHIQHLTSNKFLYTCIFSFAFAYSLILIPILRFNSQQQTCLTVYFLPSGISYVVGGDGGTLVPILTLTDDEQAYVCRKGYHALNVQAVVAPDLRYQRNITCIRKYEIVFQIYF